MMADAEYRGRKNHSGIEYNTCIFTFTLLSFFFIPTIPPKVRERMLLRASPPADTDPALAPLSMLQPMASKGSAASTRILY